MLKILESDSPYLTVKSNESGLPQLQFSKVTNQLQKRVCLIFQYVKKIIVIILGLHLQRGIK